MSTSGNRIDEYNVEIAVIGGTGVYKIEGLTDVTEVNIDTPFGSPSDRIRIGTLHGTRVAFLARHGRDHVVTPSEVPYRANIFALKRIGVKYILSVSSCGSLKEFLLPRDIVVPDQYIDRTVKRDHTFFGSGVVAHVPFDHPTCPVLSEILHKAAEAAGPKMEGHPRVHLGGTYICIEGPMFSTKAESNMHRMFGGTVVGMTGLPEARLAREAEIAYTTLACITDVDCWNASHSSVTVDVVAGNLFANARNSEKILIEAIQMIATQKPDSIAFKVLNSSVMTAVDKIPQETRTRMGVLLDRFVEHASAAPASSH